MASVVASLFGRAAGVPLIRRANRRPLEQARGDIDALLAQRENAADGSADVTPADDANANLILVDLAQRESMDVSARFAQALYREAGPVLRFQPTWHRFAAFVVLKAPDVPSVLFESGYISNRKDSAYLSSPEGRRTIAQGFRRAIEAHFAGRFLPAAGI